MFVCGFPPPMNLHLFVDLCTLTHSHFNLKPSFLVLFNSFFTIFGFNVSFMVEHLNAPTNFFRVFIHINGAPQYTMQSFCDDDSLLLLK